MHCSDCQSHLPALESLFKTHKEVNDDFARPLHSNLEDLGACADLGECQLCVVAYYRARACLKNPDTVDGKSLRVRLRHGNLREGRNPRYWYLTFQLQLKGGSPMSMLATERDWGYVPRELLSSVGQGQHPAASGYELTWMSYKVVPGKSEYTNLHDQFPPKLDESTSSEFCFTLVSTWLSECKSYHPLCKSFEDGLVFDNDQLESRLPTRLIEVGSADGMQEPRLVDIADLEIKGGGPRYIALSHRWGSTHLLTTTLGTIGAHRSTIPLATMPRTFRDAIVITRRLGIQFLWIDSLCIIQDSSSDWKSESLRMQNIYNFAHLTISAAHSTDSSSGCFRPRRGQLSRWIPYYCEDKEIPSFEYCLVPRDPYHDPTTTDADKEPLYKRGWVLQEQLLSRRTLVYSYNGLRWECLTARGSESMPKLMEHADPNDSSPRWTINGLQRFVLTDGKKDHHRMWLDIVEDFCCRDLTIAQDALAAIAGVANSMARVYGMDYLAGLWKQHLGKGLLWQLVQNDGLSLQDIGEDDRFGKIAPSWSWASASRKVKWTGDRVGLVRQTILIEVLDTQGFDSALSSVGSITLRGRAQKHKHYQSSYFPDCLSKSTTPQTSVLVFFVDKIASNHSYNTDPTIFTCLVLVPSEVDGAWQRVGLAKEKISEAEYLSLEIMDIIIV